MAILGLMLVCILIAVAFVSPDWLAALKGLVVPVVKDYPDWVLQKYESFRERPVWVELAVVFTVMGGIAADYFCYVSFIREKKWGRAHMRLASREELEVIASDPKHIARVWVRAAMIDTVLSMVMVTAIAGAFAVLGAVVLQSQQLVPEKDTDLLFHQSQFLTTLRPWLAPLYWTAVFFSFFGNVYGGPEMVVRICYEFFRSVGRERDPSSSTGFRMAAICYTLFGGLAILWIKPWFPDMRLVDIITFPAIYAGVGMCGLYCFINAWADWKFLPQPLRMSKWLALLSILAGILFVTIGAKAMIDSRNPWHLVVLPVWIAGSLLAASVTSAKLFSSVKLGNAKQMLGSSQEDLPPRDRKR